MANCDGQPFTFHAEYNTAKQQNQVPWAALERGVLMEQETGHFETCNSLTNKDGFSTTDANGESYTDPDVYQTCVGARRGHTRLVRARAARRRSSARTRRPRARQAR